MALNFPDNPQLNDTFTVNGRTYTYNGNRWRRTKPRLAAVSPTLDVANDFAAGGALHVDASTGRVGIGTANPQYELHVDGVGEVTGDFQVGQNLDVTGTVDVNGVRLTSNGSTISLSQVLSGTYSTQAATTNDDTLATTGFVQSAIANLVDSAPTTLNTLNELAAALGDDPNFATTITNSIATKQDSSTALTTSTTFGGDVSGTYNNIVITNDSHTHDSRYYTETESDARYTSTDSFQWRGTNNLTSTTTSALKTELLNRDVFDSSVSAFKTSWSYAGNGNLTDAGGLTELAGTSWLTWTDDSTDNTQGNFTALVIAPNTGGSSGGVFIYNDQGSGYSPGWREVWTSATDGSGSGLDADLLDGNHASAFATSGHTHSYLSTSGGTVSGNVTVTGRLDVNGRIYPDNWIQFDEYEGLYSPLNAAHFYPNNGSYGAWKIDGSRNNWRGIEFGGAGSNSAEAWSFMMTGAGNNYTGVHRNGVGWMWYFNYQDLYCNSYRGFNNVAGTGNASYHPSGIYSTGTNWLYGQIITNNNSINAGSGVITCGEINQNGGTVNDFYGETKFRYVSTSNDWSAQPVQSISSQDIGYACRSFNSDTHTGQLRAASGTWYCRSHNDGSYWTLAAVIANQSSRHLKQDIETWGVAKPLSSAVNTAYETAATDLINKLRVVSYRWKKQDALPADIPSERRSKALDRLNKIRRSQGLDQYDGDEAVHRCGRDCDASEENPCDMYRNWERGTIGLVAEEVGEVIPEVTNIDLYDRSSTKGQNTAIDGLALTSMCVKAIQELSARNAELEERLSQLEAANV